MALQQQLQQLVAHQALVFNHLWAQYRVKNLQDSPAPKAMRQKVPVSTFAWACVLSCNRSSRAALHRLNDRNTSSTGHERQSTLRKPMKLSRSHTPAPAAISAL